MKITINTSAKKDIYNTGADVPVGRFFNSANGLSLWLRVWDGGIQFYGDGCYSFTTEHLSRYVTNIELLPEDFSVTLGGK